jgi:hypothetical protein
VLDQVVANLSDEDADGPQRLRNVQPAPFFFSCTEERVANYSARDELWIVVRAQVLERFDE